MKTPCGLIMVSRAAARIPIRRQRRYHNFIISSLGYSRLHFFIFHATIPTNPKDPRCMAQRGSFGNRSIRLLDAVLLVELIHTAAGVDQLLLAGEEGVALGADFNGDVLLGGTGLDHIAAGAANGGLLVIGMDTLLHGHDLLIKGCHDCAASA